MEWHNIKDRIPEEGKLIAVINKDIYYNAIDRIVFCIRCESIKNRTYRVQEFPGNKFLFEEDILFWSYFELPADPVLARAEVEDSIRETRHILCNLESVLENILREGDD